MKKLSFLLAAALSITGPKLLANSITKVPLTKKQLLLGFGEGMFPVGTIKDPNGQFQLVLPPSLTFKNVEFVENFDSMCEIEAKDFQNGESLLFFIGPSSSESSRCVLNIQLSNGNTVQVIGLFSSGE